MTGIALIRLCLTVTIGGAFGNLIARNQVNERYGSMTVAIVGLVAWLVYLMVE